MASVGFTPYINNDGSNFARRPAQLATYATLTAVLIAGTGGAYDSNSMASYAATTAKPMISVIGQERRHVAAKLSTAELVLSVREAFGLNLSQFAKVFGVVRRTVYDWLQGAEPREQIQKRLWRLNEHAPLMNNFPVGKKSSLLLRPVMNGRSLLDSLEQNDSELEEVIVALKRQVDTETTKRLPRVSRGSERISVHQISRVLG